VSRVVRKQLAETRAQLERDVLRRDREKLRRLRDAVRDAKKSRTVKRRAVAANCRDARKRFTARAKKARERLNTSIRRTREQARTVCELARGEVQRDGLAHIERAINALEGERATQRQLKAWTRPKVCPARPGKARERQQESDCEVQANIDEPGLRIVWEHVKARIKPGKRRSRTEAFYEWVAEHPSEVYEIQERDAERAIAELERQERQLASTVKKATRYRKKSAEELRVILADVPF
jgi:hypothetical protein